MQPWFSEPASFWRTAAVKEETMILALGVPLLTLVLIPCDYEVLTRSGPAVLPILEASECCGFLFIMF